jgi:hypothetical protein
MQELEWKERELKDKYKKLSKRISKYKDVAPLAEEIAALQIGLDELIALKIGINEAANNNCKSFAYNDVISHSPYCRCLILGLKFTRYI